LGDSGWNALLLSALLMLACSAAAPGQIEYDTSDPAAATTSDGLLRVRGSTAASAMFVRPGTSLSSYQKLSIGPSTIAYRAASERKRNGRRPKSSHDSETTARISKILRESLGYEFLQSNRFTVVTQTGANILSIRGHAMDLDIDFSPAPAGEERHGGVLGELTLVLDVQDSQTGEQLVRLVDQIGIPRRGFGLGAEHAAPSTWRSIGARFSEWAHHGRRRLEWIADAEPAPAAAQGAGGP
jgi:hypothetical protein